MNAPLKVVGILIDAENLTGWEEGALKTLYERAALEGDVVYRRAYGDWTTCGKHASELTRLGFELVQVHHPAPRKNSADIHMTVDAMDLLAQDPELRTFVLATGDSDFAPLFRRLRERRCRVIGVRRRSCLSDAVRSPGIDFLNLGPERPRPTRPRAVRVASRCAARVEAPHPVVPVPAAQAPAENTAVAFTLVQTAKLHGLDVLASLTWALERVAVCGTCPTPTPPSPPWRTRKPSSEPAIDTR